jgi:carbamoyl-phosphate synthase large subunit
MGAQSLLERIRFIHQRERLDAIIPTLDAELQNFIQIQEELLQLHIRLTLPKEESLLKRSKVNLPKFAEEFGFKTPKTSLITDPNKLGLTKKDLPVFVKGIFYEAYLAYTIEDLHCYIQKMSAKWGYPVLLQEYIEGEEFNAATVGNQGSALGIVCMKKLALTDKGKGWACVTIKNDSLIDLTQKIVASLKWHGPIEVEVILSKKDHHFYLIELNPRFPAWIYLAKAAGINLPLICLMLALGEEWNNTTSYKTGVVFSNYTTNLITDLTRIQTLFTTGEIHYEKAL